MPLLDYQDQPEPQDASKVEAEGIIEDCGSLHRHLRSTIRNIYGRVWENPLAKPEEILKQLGPRAEALFTLSARLQDLLNEARPDSISLKRPVDVKFNGDGNVTLG